ncbi:MAG: o-succinylbenzoate--CoA ligase, partial [Deltaproteobacteria bacterium]|nr:o-succinylbenzoate--CoA ligase [Deltaproteobacteria bacterium]
MSSNHSGDCLCCPLFEAATVCGDRLAVICSEKTLTYRQLNVLVDATAERLKRLGLSPNERIAVVSDNRWELVVLFFAILRIGAVVCPISPRFPHRAVLSILEMIGCRWVIDFSARLVNKAGATHVRIIDQKVLFDDACSALGIPKKVEMDLGAEATIVLTSGTLSDPKAVLHCYGSHYYSALGANRNIAVGAEDRWLLSLPLYHVGGLAILFRMVLARGAVVIPEDRRDIPGCVARYHITHVSMVATQLYRWLHGGLGKQAPSGLKAVLVGGGPVPEALVQTALDAGLPIYTTYGLTEMASQVTTTAPGDRDDRLLTAGRALDHRQVRVACGEILVKGDTLFKGYVDGASTVLPVDAEGWFRTGDLGRMDTDGYLTVLGRKDNMFISGGENIFPEEIERRLRAVPGVEQATVVRVKDTEFGFRPVAFVKTWKDTPLDRKKL